MKILLVSLTYFYPQTGGISTLMQDAVESVGKENVICLTSQSSREKMPGFTVCRIKSMLSRNNYIRTLSVVFGMMYILIRFRPKLIQFATVDEAFIGVWINKVFKIPYIVWAHGNEIVYLCNSKNPWPTAIKALQSASKVFAVSGYTSKKVQQLGVSEKNICIIHPGCNSDFYKPTKTIASEQVNALKGKMIIITVANLVRRKGHDTVIKSLPALIANNKDILYLIVGEGRDKEYLVNLAEELKVTEYIKFFGRAASSELPELYSVAKVFVMASRDRQQESDVEGFGIVFLEANACGLAVIGGLSGGMPDAIVDGKSGYLVDPNNTVALTEKINYLLQNEAVAAEMGEFGRRRVKEDFSWLQIGKNINSEIDSIIQSGV